MGVDAAFDVSLALLDALALLLLEWDLLDLPLAFEVVVACAGFLFVFGSGMLSLCGVEAADFEDDLALVVLEEDDDFGFGERSGGGGSDNNSESCSFCTSSGSSLGAISSSGCDDDRARPNTFLSEYKSDPNTL